MNSNLLFLDENVYFKDNIIKTISLCNLSFNKREKFTLTILIFVYRFFEEKIPAIYFAWFISQNEIFLKNKMI